jgi:hypothetical protein
MQAGNIGTARVGSAEIGFIKDAPRPRLLLEPMATGRAVPLMRLAELLDPDRRAILSTERRRADEIVILQAGKSMRPIPGGGAGAA